MQKELHNGGTLQPFSLILSVAYEVSEARVKDQLVEVCINLTPHPMALLQETDNEFSDEAFIASWDYFPGIFNSKMLAPVQLARLVTFHSGEFIFFVP
jgi:hypothetical protein